MLGSITLKMNDESQYIFNMVYKIRKKVKGCNQLSIECLVKLICSL